MAPEESTNGGRVGKNVSHYCSTQRSDPQEHVVKCKHFLEATQSRGKTMSGLNKWGGTAAAVAVPALSPGFNVLIF